MSDGKRDESAEDKLTIEEAVRFVQEHCNADDIPKIAGTLLGGTLVSGFQAAFEKMAGPAEPVVLVDYGRCQKCRGKWPVYMGSYDVDGHTLRCFGCKRATAKCFCA